MSLFLQANAWLAVSFLIFAACRRAARALSPGGGDFRPWVVAAQCLVLSSLGAPAAFSLLPARALPRLELRVAEPLPEGGAGAAHRALRAAALAPPYTAHGARAGSLAGALGEALPALLRWAWLLASIALLARFAWQWLALGRLARRGLCVRGIGRVRVVVSDEIRAPFSVLLASLRGPRALVLLPSPLVAHAADYRVAVLHELEHHRRRDTAWALGMAFAGSALFFNPFFHLWKKEIAGLQEFACDDALLGRGGLSPREYAGSLLRVAEAALGSRTRFAGVAGMASGFSFKPKSFLRRRIEMFAHVQRNSTARSRKVAAALGAASILATLGMAYASQAALRPDDGALINPGLPALDPVIQSIAQTAVRRAIADRSAKAGFVIVEEPATGRILAVAGVRRQESGGYETGPWPLSYMIEPASTIKTVIAASAVERGVAGYDDLFDCGGGTYKLGSHLYKDHAPFDRLSTTETIVKSSNICGIRIGERLGPEGLARALADFGFGPGGVTAGFPAARAGRVPSPAQLPADEYIPLLSTGYTDSPGFYVSPLEIVQAYGAIANGGALMKPLEAAAPPSSAVALRRVLSREHAARWRAVLARAITDAGTGYNAESNFYTTAGKTSTAYRPGENFGGERAVGGFVGFAPAASPRVVVYAAVIDAKDRTEGNRVAAPLFRDVAEKALRALGVAPDKGL